VRNLLIKIAVPVLFGAALLAPMAAQASVNHHNINARWRHQEKRIYNGTHTGQLTPREYHNLQVREARIRDREALDRRYDHGHLTGLQHRRLERTENRDSRAIYRDKHNHRHV
jgi:hypothetical protein